MSTFEEIKPGARIKGLDPAGIAEVVSVSRFGLDALNLVFRVAGKVTERLVYRGEETGFEFVNAGRAYAFDADAGLLRLASEAYRIRLAHLFDPYLAVSASQIEALPHQITAVYGEMLAAGEGVNLQRGAHLMINYDLPWNPNRLEQRFGRIHRIGQTEVCHLWNLCAANTREGEVYRRLLEKLEEARAALGGKVYDVLGELFEGHALRDLLVDAIRYGESPEKRAELFRKVDGAVDVDAIEKLVAERKLTSEGMNPSSVAEIREQMERAAARRLQPHFIGAFFREAFTMLGGRIAEREKGRFEILRVPSILKERDRLIGRSDPVLDRYARITFEKSLIIGQPQAELVAPGHPLLESLVDVILERFQPLLNQGGVLVDDTDESLEPKLLVYLEHAIRDARIGRSGEPRAISQRLQFLFLKEDGSAEDGLSLAIDSKLRGCDLVKVKIGDLVSGGRVRSRAIIVQQKTGRPVQFELLDPARGSILAWLEQRGGTLEDFTFPSRIDHSDHISTRQYARLVDEWIIGIGLRAEDYGTHSLRRTKASIIYKQSGNLRAAQILLGHTKIESTVRYLGVDIEDALALAEGTEV